jgi:parallel beta-helix repeat protein
MGEGILLVGSPHDSIIFGNTVTNSGLGGITSSAKLTSRNLLITSNIINRTVSPSPGIHSQGATNSIITGNVVQKASGYGIVVTELSHFVVCNNIVTNSSAGNPNTYSGIYAATADNGIVGGNESYNTDNVGQKYGIQIAGGSRIEVVNNNVRNNQTGGILTSGAIDTTQMGNRWSSGPTEGRVQLGVEPGGCGNGCATVITTEFQADDNILTTNVSASGIVGTLSVDTSTDGQFVIKSSSASDTSIIFWKIVH